MPKEKVADEPQTFEPRSKKINATMHWQILSRNRYSFVTHGMYIRSVWNLRTYQAYRNMNFSKFVQSLVESYNELSSEVTLKEIARLTRC